LDTSRKIITDFKGGYSTYSTLEDISVFLGKKPEYLRGELRKIKAYKVSKRVPFKETNTYYFNKFFLSYSKGENKKIS